MSADTLQVCGPGVRETVRALKADNALFSRDGGRFLRRLLAIASEREESWFLVVEEEFQILLSDRHGGRVQKMILEQRSWSTLGML